MKRFWVFVIICIVSLGIGFTIFRFVSKSEIIQVNQTVYQANAGDEIQLDITTKNLKSGTSITATSSNDAIVRCVDADKFLFSAVKGGNASILVTSTAKDFSPINIQVSVGNGGIATPFYVSSKEDLKKIGGASGDYPTSAYYKLTASIDMLNEEWTPIAYGVDGGFTGSFDFNGCTISNLTITNRSVCSEAGFFAEIGEGGTVSGAVLNNVSFAGNFQYAGSVAGINRGTITHAVITSASITSADESAFVGGIVGLNCNQITRSQAKEVSLSATGASSYAGGIAGASQFASDSYMARIDICSATGMISSANIAGGLVGLNSGAVVENCYAGVLDSVASLVSSNQYVGGLVGWNEIHSIGAGSPRSAAVADSYSVMPVSSTDPNNAGAIIGFNSATDKNTNKLFGNYYTSTLKAVSNMDDPKPGEKGKENGCYRKTQEELESGIDVYFSSYLNGKERYWQFDKMWVFVQGSLPVLDYDSAYAPSRVSSFIEDGTVNNNNFIDIISSATNADKYKLGSNIVLDKSNYSGKMVDFAGYLYCPTDEKGEPLYTITLNFDNDSIVKSGNLALFNKLTGTLENIKVIVNYDSVTMASNIAGIVAVNSGKIINCIAEGSIGTGAIKIENEVCIGGIAAINRAGVISGSRSNVSINYKQGRDFTIGGIAAYSEAEISDCTVSESISITSSAQGKVGGIVGLLVNHVISCKNNARLNVVDSNANCYVGGIAGVLDNSGLITLSSNFGDILGSQAGGIVGRFINGSVDKSMCCATITGNYVGGLICYMDDGKIEDCLARNTLKGKDNSSVIAGDIYYINILRDEMAVHLIAINSFTGSGDKWYESYSNIRGHGKLSFRDPPISAIHDYVFENCIYLKKDDSNIKRNSYWMDNGWDWEHDAFQHGSHDIGLSEGEMTGTSDSFNKIVSECSFDESIWLLKSGEYPTIANVAKND